MILTNLINLIIVLNTLLLGVKLLKHDIEGGNNLQMQNIFETWY